MHRCVYLCGVFRTELTVSGALSVLAATKSLTASQLGALGNPSVWAAAPLSRTVKLIYQLAFHRVQLPQAVVTAIAKSVSACVPTLLPCEAMQLLVSCRILKISLTRESALWLLRRVSATCGYGSLCDVNDIARAYCAVVRVSGADAHSPVPIPPCLIGAGACALTLSSLTDLFVTQALYSSAGYVPCEHSVRLARLLEEDAVCGVPVETPTLLKILTAADTLWHSDGVAAVVGACGLCLQPLAHDLSFTDAVCALCLVIFIEKHPKYPKMPFVVASLFDRCEGVEFLSDPQSANITMRSAENPDSSVTYLQILCTQKGSMTGLAKRATAERLRVRTALTADFNRYLQSLSDAASLALCILLGNSAHGSATGETAPLCYELFGVTALLSPKVTPQNLFEALQCRMLEAAQALSAREAVRALEAILALAVQLRLHLARPAITHLTQRFYRAYASEVSCCATSTIDDYLELLTLLTNFIKVRYSKIYPRNADADLILDARERLAERFADVISKPVNEVALDKFAHATVRCKGAAELHDWLLADVLEKRQKR